ncbi:MAG: hypothetical protein IH859_04785 [Chloroflexi bacterium]|nr:hypothetical protein [Chloroflexota bacterium]
MTRILILISSIVMFGISACISSVEIEPPGGENAEPVIQDPRAVTAIVPSPEPTPTPSDVLELSYESVLYRDEEAGFQLEYPAGWSEGYGERQSRSYFQTFFSWDPSVSDSIEFVPAGGTYMQIVVSLWEPTDDLDAYVDWQSQVLEDSRNESISMEEITLSDGESGVMAVYLSADGSKLFFFFWMAIGERYLTITGEGDLELLTEIVSTLRLIGS